MTSPHGIPRDRLEKIVADLARQTRTTLAIAQRHHVPHPVVLAIRDRYGPTAAALIASAEQLRRPAPVAAAEPDVVELVDDVEPPAEPDAPASRSDGLTFEERAECRTWAMGTGRQVGAAGKIAAALVQAWNEAGRPTLDGKAAPDPAGSGLLRAAGDALRDVRGVLPYAVEHLAQDVSGLVDAALKLVESVTTDQAERDMVDRAARSLRELGLSRGEGAETRDVARELVRSMGLV